MSFREKSAWVSFVCILLVFGVYFTALAQAIAGSLDYGTVFRIFIGGIVALIVLEIVLHIIIAVQAPRDAAAPKDERDRMIELKATRIAFFTLLAGAAISIFTIHLGADVRALANSVLFAIVIAELVKYGSEIVYFRRGA